MMALIQRLNQAGHTIIVITHAMAVAAEFARRVILMRDGRIVRDASAREIFSDESGLLDLGLTPPPVVQVGNRLGVPALTHGELVGSLALAARPPGPSASEPRP
jgi:energy-coupling factor transport system ATP-binding protein